MEFLISKEQTKELLKQKNTKIIDCRFSLQNSSEGKKLYEKGHIPGAFYFDLEKQLSGPVSEHGGRHPLPDLKKFRAEVEKIGIDLDQKVIVYDDGGMAFASRAWWLLTYMGHEQVYILEEGFQGWKNADYPISTEIPLVGKQAHFEGTLRKEMLTSYEEVKQMITEKNEEMVLIDSRAKERYQGDFEPIDRIPGHIPGALNKVWTDGVTNGTFKGEKEQQKRFSELDVEKPVIVYCGSGVTAIPNVLALKMAGFKDVSLYAGSYSDWVSYKENPVQKGPEA